MISKTWVAPPVGSGRAGTASRTTRMTAKLRVPKSSIRLASVLGSSPASQASSSPLSDVSVLRS